MRCFFTLLAAAKLIAVVGEPLVFILPSSDKAKAATKQHVHHERSKDVDFGRKLQAQDINNRGLLPGKKLDPSKIRHIPKPEKAAFQSAGETGLLDFDNPLEAVFTSKFHLQDMARRLGKGSKSKSSKPKSSNPKSSKPKSSNPKSSKSKSSKSKSSNPKSSKSKSSNPKSSKSKSSKSSKSKSSARSAHHSSVSTSKSTSSESRSTSSDTSFSYHIGSDSLWSMDEAEDSTTPEEFGRPPKVKTAVTASPVSAKSKPDIVYYVEPQPREEKLLVSDFTNLDSSSTPVVSSAIKPTVDIEGEDLGSKRMFYVAGAALFGGLVAFVASIFIKRKVNPGNTHVKMNESIVQDDTVTDGEGSLSHYDSWLASDMRAW